MLFRNQKYVLWKKHGSCAYFYGANLFEGKFLLHKTLRSFINKTIHILYSSGNESIFPLYFMLEFFGYKKFTGQLY